MIYARFPSIAPVWKCRHLFHEEDGIRLFLKLSTQLMPQNNNKKDKKKAAI